MDCLGRWYLHREKCLFSAPGYRSIPARHLANMCCRLTSRWEVEEWGYLVYWNRAHGVVPSHTGMLWAVLLCPVLFTVFFCWGLTIILWDRRVILSSHFTGKESLQGDSLVQEHTTMAELDLNSSFLTPYPKPFLLYSLFCLNCLLGREAEGACNFDWLCMFSVDVVWRKGGEVRLKWKLRSSIASVVNQGQTWYLVVIKSIPGLEL